MLRITALSLIACLLLACSDPDQSVFLYRLPYQNDTSVNVWQDHLTHSPINRIDFAGVDGTAPYGVVAANTGVVRFIEDGLTQNCCGGSCGNNYLWLEHIGGEWTKYSHLATDSVRGDAGLSEGDIVLAGSFIGWESNVGRACGSNNGRHLHFAVTSITNANPSILDSIGNLSGTDRIPRFCHAPDYTVVQGERYRARNCDPLLNCIRSVETPATEDQCETGLSGEVCVQQVNNPINSTYQHGIDFESESVQINLDWCGNASCSPTQTGRAISVVIQHQNQNLPPTEFTANCQQPSINQTVHNVASITIQDAQNLSDENVACGGNHVQAAFARWEICDISTLLVDEL